MTQFNPFSHEIERVIYATNSQLEIWTDCILGGNDANKAYNLSVSLRLKGNLVVEALDHAVDSLVRRHECLRSSFSSDGRFMNIYSDLKIEISHHDITQLGTIEKKEAEDELLKQELNSLFDLVNGPLFKVKLIKAGASEHILILTHHHIIGDGLSFDIILEELSALYSSYLENKTPDLPKPERFSDFAEKVNTLAESKEYKLLEDYWIRIYQESVPIIELPIDYIRPSKRTYNSDRLDFPVDDNLINALKQVGISAGCSLVTTLLAAFEICLCKLTGQNDLVVGFPSSGNILFDMRQMIGDCVNLLPLRSKVNPNTSFIDYLKQRNSQLFDDYEHQQVSFGHLLKHFAIPRDPARVPLVPVILTVDLNRDIESEFSFAGLSHEFKINPREYATFEIQLHAFRAKNGPSFQWSYNTTLFKPDTIREMMRVFEDLMKGLTAKPHNPISELIGGDYLADYNILNNTESPYPDVDISELLRKQVEITPDKIALKFHDSETTYSELQKKVNQLAHYLKTHGVQSGDFIAVSLPRSPETVYALLAILQCGAAYLPLDPEYPKERLELMLNDSGSKFLLSSKALSKSFTFWSDTLFIEDAMKALSQYPASPLDTVVAPEDTAYILYTSGSTGRPKGVPITHKNLVNFLFSMASTPGITGKDRVLSVTTISFDIAGLELYLPLINGATLIIADQETARDGRLLLELTKKENISFLQATPTTWRMLLDSGWTDPLPLKALCGGEALPVDLARQLVLKCDTLWNVYGPTETTIWSSVKQIKADDASITIGKPIANTQFYLLDAQGQLVAPGNIGEIAIGGDGVAKGYWNRPELTAERFIENKFSNTKGKTLYRTGDLGKLLPNHEIECLGRIDQQVKIRGYRIEPGEVEKALLSLEGVKQTVVLANENFLIAHIVPDSTVEVAEIKISLWRETLASQLPPQLVPHDFNLLEKLPTTLNRKVDLKALLQYKTNKKLKYIEPRTEEEKIVAAIWKEGLNIEEIDIFGNFFEMGGHSLIAVRVMSMLEQKTGKRLPLSALFEHSTVEKFAKLLKVDSEINSDCIVPIKPGGNKVPLFIVHGAGLNVLNFIHLGKHFDEDQPVYGIQGNGPRGYDDWYESIEAMAAYYIDAIMKINPEGPYALAGFSFGGIVAFEMTRQLNERGKKVSLTAILDTYVDSAYYYETYTQKRVAKYLDRTRRRFDYLLQMLTSWELLKLRFSSKKQFILKKYFGVKEILSEEETIALEQFAAADRMVKGIINRYHLKPQHIKVDLFRSKENELYKTDPIYFGWKKAALKGVIIHNISGNHLDIVAPPNDKILARLLQDVLNKRHASTYASAAELVEMDSF